MALEGVVPPSLLAMRVLRVRRDLRSDALFFFLTVVSSCRLAAFMNIGLSFSTVTSSGLKPAKSVRNSYCVEIRFLMILSSMRGNEPRIFYGGYDSTRTVIFSGCVGRRGVGGGEGVSNRP